MTLEQFKKDLDEKLDAISDEELIQEFKALGCEVRIEKLNNNMDYKKDIMALYENSTSDRSDRRYIN